MIEVAIHQEDEMGNVFTLKNRWGLRIKWDGREFVIPRGFKSDGASVPRFFWRLVFPSSDTKALRASLAHDYIYRTHPEGWTKADADKMYYDLLIEDGVATWRSWLAYQGVKLFGGWSWRTKGGLADGNGE